MTIIWRGIGILVPLAFLGFGALMTIWFDNPTLGNRPYFGWTSLCTAVFCLILGIGTFPGKTKSKYSDEMIPRKKHDFFFIPIIVWAFIFAGIAVWQLDVFNGFKGFKGFKSRSDKLTFKDTETMSRWPSRTVNFYNPTQDTLRFVAVNTDYETENWWVNPQDSVRIELLADKYLLVAFDQHEKMRYNKVPTAAEAADKSLYEEWTDPGDGSKQMLRIIKGGTTDMSDYDDAWMLLDENYSMLFIDITDICNEDPDKRDAEIDDTDWQDKIYNDYAGGDLMEPYIKGNIRDKMFSLAYIYTVLPNRKIPGKVHENADVYLLMPYKTGSKPSNEAIAKQIKQNGFED